MGKSCVHFAMVLRGCQAWNGVGIDIGGLAVAFEGKALTPSVGGLCVHHGSLHDNSVIDVCKVEVPLVMGVVHLELDHGGCRHGGKGLQ